MKFQLAFLSGFVLGSAISFAGPAALEKEVVVPEDPKTCCDGYGDVLDLAKLYQGDGPLIQEIKLIGRYQGQYHDVESDADDSDWENRRFRFGIAAQFLRNFEFEGQFNLKTDFSESGRLFEDVDTLFVTWEPNDRYSLSIGKQKPGVTREYSISSKRIKTIERSQIVNQIVPDKAGGAVLTFNDIRGFTFDVGAFSGDVSDDWKLPEIGGLGNYARLGRNITEATNVRLDWFHGVEGDSRRQVNAFSGYHDHWSLNSLSDWKRFHLLTDLIYATGHEHSDVLGAVFMPYFDITDKLEAVFRYSYTHADEPDGVILQSRYERAAAPSARGNTYNALYGGLNYYICGDKLKIMNGIEWSHLDGFNDEEHSFWTFLTAVRMYF